MANHRMFSTRILNSARFLQMPLEAQLLYFHMILRADDDGVVESYPIIKLLGTTPDSFRVLLARGFVLVLNEDQVVVVNEWTEHNKIRSDRKVDSLYLPLLREKYPEIPIIKAKPRSDVKDNSRRLNTKSGGLSVDGISKGKLSKERHSDLLSKSASASEDWSTEQMDEEGNTVGRKSKLPRVPQNGGAVRVVQYFAEKALAYIGQPVVSNGYGHVKRLMEGKGKCTEEFLKKVIDDFFEESPTNERAGNIFVCLSARNINRMIAESHG